jgi:four helix bundle protein
MDQIQNSKRYDLEERTFQFAKEVAFFVKTLPKNSSNQVYSGQVVRSSGSVGANYIEANEALGKKDFLMRIRICRKEAKESAYWLRLIVETNNDLSDENGLKLKKEAEELKKIFSSIHEKSK